MPDGGGTSLGTATGTVRINAELDAASAQIKAFSQQTEQQFKKVDASSKQTSDALKTLATVFGVSLGAAGVVQAGKALLQLGADSVKAASDLNESVNKIDVAFGSSGKEILDWSEDSARALGQSQQQALEAASSFGLLFSTMNVGEEESAKMSRALVQLATDMASINNISPEDALLKLRSGLVGESEPLRSVGVLLDEASVQAKAMAMGLAPTTAALSQQDKVLARYQLILEQTSKTQGDFARTSGEVANQVRIEQAAWDNYLATLGKAELPAAKGGVSLLTDALTAQTSILQTEIDLWNKYVEAVQNAAHAFDQSWLGQALGGKAPGTPAWMTSVPKSASGPLKSVDTVRNSDAIDKAWSDHFDKVTELERQANDALTQENTSYQSRRLRSEEQYQENVANSAADFAKGRMRAQEDYESSILDIMRSAQQRDARMAEDHARAIERMQSDSAKRLSDLQEDLDRNNAQKRIDSADKVAEMAVDHDKAIADKRAGSLDRISQIEEDYQRQREQAARDHGDKLSDAAARLDAQAIYQEQRSFNRSQDEAAKANQEKVSDEGKKLDEAIANLNTSYNEKLADEQKALDKSISQANEAHQRQVDDEKEALQTRIDDANAAYTQQLADAKAADAQRITDMAAHFELQKNREDADQAERMGRMATDHAAEMTQMDTEHGARLTQISDHAQDERDTLDAEFRKQLHDLGVHNDAYDKAEKQHQEQIKLSQGIFHEQEQKALTNANIAMLKILQLNPFLDTDQIGAITTALTALGQLIVTNDTNIGILQGKLDALPANPYLLAPKSDEASPVPPGGPSAQGFITPAALAMTSATGGGGTVANVSFAQGAIVIYGAPGQSVEALAGIIDQRILSAVTKAAGRL